MYIPNNVQYSKYKRATEHTGIYSHWSSHPTDHHRQAIMVCWELQWEYMPVCSVALLYLLYCTLLGIYIFTDIVGWSSNTVTEMASKEIKFDEKCKIKAITLFKVIQGHRGWYQS